MTDNSELQTLLYQVSQANQLVIHLQHALDQSAIVAITDPRGVITYINQKFLDISQYSKDELIGKTHKVVNSGYHSTEFFSNMWSTIKSGHVWAGLICNRRKDGELYWVDTTIVPVRQSDGKIEKYISIRYDVTKHKQTEKQLQEERERLYESEKMASLGLLASGLSHELGNPLSALRGRLEMLSDSCDQKQINPSEFKDETEKMISLVDRMSKIIRGLKTYARNDKQDPKVIVNISSLVRDIIAISHERCRRHQIKVELQGFDDDIEILGREAELGQVFVNLFNNAIDAVKELEDRWITISLNLGESNIKIKMTDSGCGIANELSSRIFDPFYTTKPVGEGTGLGLSISRSIIENHQGTLIVDRKSKNTCFIITLPCQ